MHTETLLDIILFHNNNVIKTVKIITNHWSICKNSIKVVDKWYEHVNFQKCQKIKL